MIKDPVERINWLGLVPVIVIDNPRNAVPLGQALVEVGLPCAEITFRTEAAGEAIRHMVDTNEDLLVGAGTILTPQQAADAVGAGAHFIVAPGFNPRVVDFCQEQTIPVFPGVCTPTEIEAGLEKGLEIFKFFPAEAIGGLNYLKAIAAPYSRARFIPTGGINAHNLADYLAFKAVAACGGSWMVERGLIEAGRFDEIQLLVSEALGTVRTVRGAWHL